MNKKDIIPRNDKFEQHGYSELYHYGKIYTRAVFKKGFIVGYREVHFTLKEHYSLLDERK